LTAAQAGTGVTARACASGELDQPSRFLVALFRHVGDDHAGAFMRKRQCRSTTDTGSCACHEGDFAAEGTIFITHRLHP
jgi:hypothetical protein